MPLAVEKDGRGNAKASTDFTGGYKTNVAQGVCCRRHPPRPEPGGLGDPRRAPGRRAVDEFLMGYSDLPAVRPEKQAFGAKSRIIDKAGPAPAFSFNDRHPNSRRTAPPHFWVW
jgi:hypothetical protein